MGCGLLHLHCALSAAVGLLFTELLIYEGQYTIQRLRV